MTDGVFAQYQERGVLSREAAVITRAESDADPILCAGEGQFTVHGRLLDLVGLIREASGEHGLHEMDDDEDRGYSVARTDARAFCAETHAMTTAGMRRRTDECVATGGSSSSDENARNSFTTKQQ
jgi:hypothetical protein